MNLLIRCILTGMFIFMLFKVLFILMVRLYKQVMEYIKVRQSKHLHFSHADNAEILLFDLGGIETQYR